jgi:hypothetical protein
MRKLKIRTKLTVDILMFTAFLFNAFTGLAYLLGFAGGGGQHLRGGRGAVESTSIFDLGSRSTFSIIHDWSGIIIIILIIVHLILSWDTLVCYFKSAFRNAKVAKIGQSCENV